jgi:adenylate cyclase
MAEERVQRRLAAIMAADVVGYSRLMGEDETGTLNALKELRAGLIDPAIREHRGRMVKLMGDGALVEFASVVDAVECAFAIQQSMADKNAGASDNKQIVFRIGINLGDIIIEGRDIYGDGVNVAARLEGIAEPGGICISGTAFDQVKGKLDLPFDDLGLQQVKNIAEPVRVYRIPVEPNADTELEPRTTDTPPTQSDKPSIAVLPFNNLSDDPQQEYFSDGLAEDLITDLSKISRLSVTARNSSFSFKGQMLDIKDVAKKLGVTFVLEGSVRKMGDRLRINAQLIDGADGRHIWAERYDGNMAEIFDFQDAIREQIVSALQVSLTPTDEVLAERKPTNSVEAYDLFLKGRANYFRYTPENLIEAKQCLEEAIELDPEYAEAYGYLSYCHILGWTLKLPAFDDALDYANELAEKGVALDGTSAIALTRLGWVQTFLRQYELAVANYERAIALAPNNAEVLASYAEVSNWLGKPEQALQLMDKVFEIDTIVPPSWDLHVGHAHLLLRNFDRALSSIIAALDRAPKFTPALELLACTYVELGRIDDAREVVSRILNISTEYYLSHAPSVQNHRNDEDRKRFVDDLRKAGLPG